MRPVDYARIAATQDGLPIRTQVPPPTSDWEHC